MRKPFWTREIHGARRPKLLARAAIAAAARELFASQGFIEVEPAILQTSPGNETHLHGFSTDLVGMDGGTRRRHLHTSPEFAMKKLLAAGEEKIFALCPVFRNREASALHTPEFTMLEWYRANAPLEALMEDCGALLRLAAARAGARAFSYRGRTCDPLAAPERLPVIEAFGRHAGVDLGAMLPDRPDALERIGEAARAIGVGPAPDDGWSDLFSKILSARVEPRLGVGAATLLCDYPASEAALARINPVDPRLALRFELYACGVELANAFAELTDANEQRRRFEADMAEKQRIHGYRDPLDEDFLAALARMPDAAGAALGFDRLVMLATGATSVAEVQWTPATD